MLKLGEFYCVADLTVQSHGLMLRESKIQHRVKEENISSFGGQDYLELRQPDVAVPMSDAGKFWFNNEARTGPATWYLIYPAFMPRAEVEAMLKSETERVVNLHVSMYEKMYNNAKMMADIVAKGEWQPSAHGFDVIIREKK